MSLVAQSRVRKTSYQVHSFGVEGQQQLNETGAGIGSVTSRTPPEC